MSTPIAFVLLLAALAVGFVDAEAKFFAENNCAVLNTSLGFLDLSRLPPAYFNGDQFFDNGASGYVWAVDFCKAAAPLPPGSETCTTRGYVEQYGAGEHHSCEQMFTKVTKAFSWNGTAVNGEFQTAASFTMKVGLTCDPSVSQYQLVHDLYADMNADGKVTWGMQLYTSAVCPGMDITVTVEGPNGVAVAFIVIVFVVPALYFLVGILWNFFRAGKRGKEMIPQAEFWASFPGLVKDGFVFTFTSIRNLCLRICRRGGGGDYSSV